MARKYDTATERMVIMEKEPLNLRVFSLILINVATLATKRVDFDRTQAKISDILGGDDFVDNADRIALRTQLIPKPLDPASHTSTAPKLLQFFAVDPNHNSLVERGNAALITEIVDGEDIPLFLLNADEVWNIAHGDGFATEIQIDEALVAAK